MCKKEGISKQTTFSLEDGASAAEELLKQKDILLDCNPDGMVSFNQFPSHYDYNTSFRKRILSRFIDINIVIRNTKVGKLGREGQLNPVVMFVIFEFEVFPCHLFQFLDRCHFLLNNQLREWIRFSWKLSINK